MRIISPSLLSADFSNLAKQIHILEEMGATRLHLDVMDGHFVPNLTFGPFIIEQIKKITNLHLETHLMIKEPSKYVNNYINAGSDTVIIHLEASSSINSDIKMIKRHNVQAGLAINPDTDESALSPYFKDIDYILIMSVFPGFGGQSFIEKSLDKMKKIVKLSNGRQVIGVDGGVNDKNIGKIYKTGIDITIIGSSLFKSDNLPSRYRELLIA